MIFSVLVSLLLYIVGDSIVVLLMLVLSIKIQGRAYTTCTFLPALFAVRVLDVNLLELY